MVEREAGGVASAGGAERAGGEPAADGAGLRLGAALAIGLVAVGRTLVTFAEQRRFDVDPAIDPAPLPGLGPAGSQALDVLTLVAAAVGAIGLWRGGRWPGGGRGPAAWAWVLLVPAAVVLLGHGRAAMANQWLGSAWIAAVAAGAVAWGLAGEQRCRAVLVALLLATMVPLAARGVMQVSVGPWTGPEHAETLRQWRGQREAFFADRGWAEDSPAARIFERRLMQPQPTGWFPTTNVFATLAGATLLLGAGLAWAAARGRAGRAAVAVPAVVAAVAGGLLALTGSKGAWAATLLGAGVLAAAALPVGRRLLRRAGPWLGLLVVPGMLGLVVLRGVLPEDFGGDRSVLFRWHYLQGAAGTLGESAVTGVGAGGFDEAYLRHRPLRSPEEVASAHSVAADWLVAGGIASLGWLAGLLAVAWAVGRAAGREPNGEPPAEVRVGGDAADRGRIGGLDAVLAAGIGVVVVAAIVAELGRLGDLELMARLAGGAGAVLVAITVRRLLTDGRVVLPAAVLAAPAILVLAHAQIEMTATQPGAATWWAVLLGVAAAAASEGVRGQSVRVRAAAPTAACAVLAGLAIVVTLGGLAPAARQAARAAEASELVASAAAATPRGPVPTTARLAAADGLLVAARIAPPASWMPPAAARQLALGFAAARTEAERRAALELARTAFPPDPPATTPIGTLVATAELLELRAAAGEPDARDAAIAVARRIAARDPHGTGAARRLALLLDRAGRTAAAATAARDALAIDAAKVLDPAKQLAPPDRAELERIAGAGDP